MVLYHYTTGQGIFGILNSSKLHCSNINFLNDPSEETYFKEVLSEVLAASNECRAIHDKLYNQSYEEVILNPTAKFIVSFSKNPDSLSMWNYYASGNGYSIGIDIDSVITANKCFEMDILKAELIYDKLVQASRIKDLILGFKHDCESFLELEHKMETAKSDEDLQMYFVEQGYIEQKYGSRLFELGLTFKHRAYEREEEVRLIISLNQQGDIQEEYKVSPSGVFVEYIALSLKLKEHLKSVTVHPLNGDLHQKGVDKFIASKIGRNVLQSNRSSIPFRVV